MKVTFIGATHEVTGSCSLLEVGNSAFLVDCGMEQGENRFENIPLPVNPAELSCVLLTHAHIDHPQRVAGLFCVGTQTSSRVRSTSCAERARNGSTSARP